MSVIETLNRNPRMDRREFMGVVRDGILTAVATGAVFGTALGLRESLRTEHLQEFHSQSLHADWVPPLPGEAALAGIRPTSIPSQELLLQELLGSYYKPSISLIGESLWKYAPKIIAGMPSSLGKSWETYRDELFSTALGAESLTALVTGMVLRYEHHGVEIVRSRNTLLRQLGMKPAEVTMVPIQPHIHPRLGDDGTPFLLDDLGNTGLALFIDGRGIGGDINRYIGNNEEVNFSFQAGFIDLYCVTRIRRADGSIVTIPPTYSFRGAYERDRALASISSLQELVNAVPGVDVNCAMGNNHDYPWDAVDQLTRQGKWPSERTLFVNEAMIVGQTKRMINGKSVLVPVYRQWHETTNRDVSINTVLFNLGWGSSTANEVVSTTKEVLLNRGVQRKDLNPFILTHTPLQFQEDGSEIRVIQNTADIRQHLLQL